MLKPFIQIIGVFKFSFHQRERKKEKKEGGEKKERKGERKSGTSLVVE